MERSGRVTSPPRRKTRHIIDSLSQTLSYTQTIHHIERPRLHPSLQPALHIMGCEMLSSCKPCRSWRSCSWCHCLRKSTNRYMSRSAWRRIGVCVRAAHTEEAWALFTQLEHWQEPLAQLQLLLDPQELENSRLRMSVGSDGNDGKHTSSSVRRSRP